MNIIKYSTYIIAFSILCIIISTSFYYIRISLTTKTSILENTNKEIKYKKLEIFKILKLIFILSILFTLYFINKYYNSKIIEPLLISINTQEISTHSSSYDLEAYISIFYILFYIIYYYKTIRRFIKNILYFIYKKYSDLKSRVRSKFTSLHPSKPIKYIENYNKIEEKKLQSNIETNTTSQIYGDRPNLNNFQNELKSGSLRKTISPELVEIIEHKSLSINDKREAIVDFYKDLLYSIGNMTYRSNKILDIDYSSEFRPMRSTIAYFIHFCNLHNWNSNSSMFDEVISCNAEVIEIIKLFKNKYNNNSIYEKLIIKHEKIIQYFQALK